MYRRLLILLALSGMVQAKKPGHMGGDVPHCRAGHADHHSDPAESNGGQW